MDNEKKLNEATGAAGTTAIGGPSAAPGCATVLTLDQDGDGDFWLYVDGHPFPIKIVNRREAVKMHQIYMGNRGEKFVA